jgi:hypothetical protein
MVVADDDEPFLGAAIGRKSCSSLDTDLGRMMRILPCLNISPHHSFRASDVLVGDQGVKTAVL